MGGPARVGPRWTVVGDAVAISKLRRAAEGGQEGGADEDDHRVAGEPFQQPAGAPVLGRLDPEPIEHVGGGPLRREELGTPGSPDACAGPPVSANSSGRNLAGDSPARVTART